ALPANSAPRTPPFAPRRRSYSKCQMRRSELCSRTFRGRFLLGGIEQGGGQVPDRFERGPDMAFKNLRRPIALSGYRRLRQLLMLVMDVPGNGLARHHQTPVTLRLLIENPEKMVHPA